MLVAVKMPHTEFEVRGDNVPQDVIEFFRKRFGADNVVVDEDEYVDVDDIPEFREFKANLTPGKVIRFHRKTLKKLTQAQLAAMVGCDKMTISRMERDVQPVGKKTALRLSKVLGVGVGLLLKE